VCRWSSSPLPPALGLPPLYPLPAGHELRDCVLAIDLTCLGREGGRQASRRRTGKQTASSQGDSARSTAKIITSTFGKCRAPRCTLLTSSRHRSSWMWLFRTFFRSQKYHAPTRTYAHIHSHTNTHASLLHACTVLVLIFCLSLLLYFTLNSNNNYTRHCARQCLPLFVSSIYI